MESISVEPVRIREKRVNLNPLRNPISSLHQWTALKAKDGDNGGGDIETGSCNSYQVFPKKGRNRNHGNPLLNPVADLHEWRALLAKDTKQLTTEQPLPLQLPPEIDKEVVVDASLSCWLSSSETKPTNK